MMQYFCCILKYIKKYASTVILGEQHLRFRLVLRYVSSQYNSPRHCHIKPAKFDERHHNLSYVVNCIQFEEVRRKCDVFSYKSRHKPINITYKFLYQILKLINAQWELTVPIFLSNCYDCVVKSFRRLSNLSPR